GPILWVISTTTLRQTVTPAALLGRVSAINIMSYGARPIGALLGTLVAMSWGPGISLAVAAAGFFVQLCVIAASPAARLVQQPA
ncbi:MAG TPA: MFS transporter, partial [Burkholderiales bacterium]